MGQPTVSFDAVDNCCLDVISMEAMNFQDDIPSIPFDKIKVHHVRVFDLTSMQNATENGHYAELIGELVTLELTFTCPLEIDTELFVLGERISPIAVDTFGAVAKNIWNR